VLPRIKSDLVDLLKATAYGTLDDTDFEVDQDAATTVVMVAGGYPEAYEKGDSITGISQVTNATVFHAGTKFGENGDILTNGGRVIAVTGRGDSVAKALKNSYTGIAKISWKDEYHRTDIGQDILQLIN
jgi:phosphoribosylamine--glycine ligase